jgi:hypothetical protein
MLEVLSCVRIISGLAKTIAPAGALKIFSANVCGFIISLLDEIL